MVAQQYQARNSKIDHMNSRLGRHCGTYISHWKFLQLHARARTSRYLAALDSRAAFVVLRSRRHFVTARDCHASEEISEGCEPSITGETTRRAQGEGTGHGVDAAVRLFQQQEEKVMRTMFKTAITAVIAMVWIGMGFVSRAMLNAQVLALSRSEVCRQQSWEGRPLSVGQPRTQIRRSLQAAVPVS